MISKLEVSYLSTQVSKIISSTSKGWIISFGSAHNLEEAGVGGVNNALSGDGDPPDAVERSLALFVGLVNVASVNQSTPLGVSVPRELDPEDLRHEASVRWRERDPPGSDRQPDEQVPRRRREGDRDRRRLEAVGRVAAPSVEFCKLRFEMMAAA